MLQAQAKGMFCSSCDAPSGMNCKRWEPHRGFDVGFVIHGQDLGDDGTKETLRFEEALSPESREHCHCGVVGGYIENDARSWGSIFCLLVFLPARGWKNGIRAELVCSACSTWH